ARKIADGAGITFDNLILNEELAWALSGVQFIPTTVFVDSDGRMVGEVIVGANTCAYINRLESLLDGWNYKG
ncbi:MAG: TlpA family protein disulfide reductase, partial [Clostridia bacterium]|nr:TlpA family protein disulfide reductase [Clostridia bacterium]